MLRRSRPSSTSTHSPSSGGPPWQPGRPTSMRGPERRSRQRRRHSLLARRDDARSWIARGRRAAGDDIAMRIGLDALEAWVITFLDHRPTEGWAALGGGPPTRSRSRDRGRWRRAARSPPNGMPTSRRSKPRGWPPSRADRVDGMRELSDELFAASRGFDETAADRGVDPERNDIARRAPLPRGRGGLPARVDARTRAGAAQDRHQCWPLAGPDPPRPWRSSGGSIGRARRSRRSSPGSATTRSVRSRSRTAGHVIALTTGAWREGIDGLVATAAGEPDPHARLVVHQEIAVLLARVGGERHRDESRRPDCRRPRLRRAGGLPTLPPRARADVGRGPGPDRTRLDESAPSLAAWDDRTSAIRSRTTPSTAAGSGALRRRDETDLQPVSRRSAHSSSSPTASERRRRRVCGHASTSPAPCPASIAAAASEAFREVASQSGGDRGPHPSAASPSRNCARWASERGAAGRQQGQLSRGPAGER